MVSPEKVEEQQQNDNGSIHYSCGNSKNDQEDIIYVRWNTKENWQGIRFYSLLANTPAITCNDV